MSKVKIIKKNDEYSLEYSIGDICEVSGTWFGGVHIVGKTGVPVSLDKDEYVELAEEVKPVEIPVTAGHPEGSGEPAPEEDDIPERGIQVGDLVQHFKREWVSAESQEYLYRILAFAQHTENGEKLVIYQAMYPPYKTCARPYAMFMSEVDREKYPDVKQKYRFEKIETKRWNI